MSYYEFIENFVLKEKGKMSQDATKSKIDEITASSLESNSPFMYYSTPRRQSSIPQVDSPKLSEIGRALSSHSVNSSIPKSSESSRGPLSFFKEEIKEMVARLIREWQMDSNWSGNPDSLIAQLTDQYFEDEKIFHLAHSPELAYITMTDVISKRIDYRLRCYLGNLV